MHFLIVCPSRSSLGQAIELAQGMLGHDFTIHADYIPRSLSEMPPGRNFEFELSHVTILKTIWRFDHLITFGSTALDPHSRSFFLSILFAQFSRQTIDIQHGLFQEGYTASLSTPTFDAEIPVSWKDYGTLLPVLSRRSFTRMRIGISTNLHWSIYTEQERSLFRRSIVALAFGFPNHDLIWRPHPSEFDYSADRSPQYDTLGVGARNLYVQSFAETDTTTADDFLMSTDLLVSSPSTMIADAVRTSTPVVVFECAHLRNDLAGLPITRWRRPQEIVDQAKAALRSDRHPVEAVVPVFNFNKFRHLIDGLGEPGPCFDRKTQIAKAFQLSDAFGITA